MSGLDSSPSLFLSFAPGELTSFLARLRIPGVTSALVSEICENVEQTDPSDQGQQP